MEPGPQNYPRMAELRRRLAARLELINCALARLDRLDATWERLGEARAGVTKPSLRREELLKAKAALETTLHQMDCELGWRN